LKRISQHSTNTHCHSGIKPGKDPLVLNTTVSKLRCPRQKKGGARCGAPLSLLVPGKPSGGDAVFFEVATGKLECRQCKSGYPILAGVAIVVDDVRGYLLGHVKGIAQVVPDSEIPREFQREFQDAKAEIQAGHIEDDLEAERVISLYLMNHYLHAEGAWWKPRSGTASPLIDSLVREHWDQGPLARIALWLGKRPGLGNLIELGCGVGGLYPKLQGKLATYLGVDSSFASIALARHLALGAPYRGKIRVPEDLLQGPVSREIKIAPAGSLDGRADYVVGDLESPPIVTGEWDLSVALNAIDMLEDPSDLPRQQHALLKAGGVAIQSCPYIWHEAVARKLRGKIPREIHDSAKAVKWLYEREGFRIVDETDHVPWLFFKHVRQLEVYSVHWFAAATEAAPIMSENG
jgi:SAM-dependent methyltransferase